MSAFKAQLDTVQATEDPNTFRADVLPSWLQGRTAFGGLSTALLYQAMRELVDEDRRLRSMAVSFVGPLPAGPCEISLRKMREGGSVTHMQGEVISNDEVALSAIATFGKDRASRIHVDTPIMPKVNAPDDSMPMPYIEGMTPVFTQHFDMRFSHGEPPFSGADSADFGMWIRFRDSTELDLAALLAIGDVPPMPGLNMTTPPSVGSSLTWYLELSPRMPELKPDTWVYYDYRCRAAGDGYYSNAATLWTQQGEALMFGQQIATVFEK